MKSQRVLQTKSMQFALDIVVLVRKLKVDCQYELAHQLWKSGTSIGANVEEAQGAQSRKDFISKLAIARKEARETKYWLTLLMHTSPDLDIKCHLATISELIALLTAIIKTTITNS